MNEVIELGQGILVHRNQLRCRTHRRQAWIAKDSDARLVPEDHPYAGTQLEWLQGGSAQVVPVSRIGIALEFWGK